MSRKLKTKNRGVEGVIIVVVVVAILVDGFINKSWERERAKKKHIIIIYTQMWSRNDQLATAGVLVLLLEQALEEAALLTLRLGADGQVEVVAAAVAAAAAVFE